MMEAVKEFLAPKTFGTWVYICSIVQFLCGVVFTWITAALKEREAEKFTCYVSPESTLIYKTQVDKACFSKYQQHYNAPLPFYIFVILSTWFPIVVAVIYSLSARHRVDQVDSNDGEADNQVQNRTFYVFRFYFVHLAIRVLCGVLFTVLQHVLLFPRGFSFKFGCNLPPTVLPTKIPKNTSVSQLNNTASIACENTSDKHTMWVIISVFNCGFALIILAEIIRLCRRFPIWKYIIGTKCDIEFITIYLLKRKYMREESELTSVSSNLQLAPVISNLQQESVSSNLRQRSVSSHLPQGQGCVSSNLQLERVSPNLQQEPVSPNLQQCVDDYKRQVLRLPRSTGLNLGTSSKDDFDELYINLVIHTERAPHKFSKDMERHEIYDVYMEVPQKSTRLKEVKDLFYPNKDTKQKCPRNILVVGRPGIGKTVLTEKIMRDWASRVDKFYHDKIAFFLKFRWFNAKDMKDMTLKTFLCMGTQLSDKEFEKIYEEITKRPEKAILIFDGLDEFDSDSDCLNDLPPANNPNCPMSPISLFSKLISGHFLPEATVVITSRPTAHKFYSKYNYDRAVEIIGFTQDRIEEYVTKFCNSHDRDDLEPKIWNHIKSSSDLLNSCYIPVNCWIVVTILFERAQADPANEIESLPTTLTELYQAAVTHLDENHFRKIGGQSSEEAIKKLQTLAFKGIETMQLIFENELFDEQMKQSGLLNSLSNPHSQAQTHFCFIHLTIQEFLAASHVIEMFSPKEIKKFIFSHIEEPKWHLVLQFIAGLLGKEIKMFQKDRYKDCVLAFAKSFELNTSEDGVFDVERNSSLLIMKCLREVEDEEIVKEACETTAINDIVGLRKGYGPVTLTSSDWSAVFLVCKHMKNLKKLDLVNAHLSEESYLGILRLLEQRCVEELWLRRPRFGITGNIFKTLMKSKCSLNHEHSKLIKLHIFEHEVTDEILSTMSEFFRKGHAICLKKLSLYRCEISSRKLSIFFEHVLTNEHYKLEELTLRDCSLTDDCLPELCNALQHEHCRLNRLVLVGNKFTEKGKKSICEIETHELCKARDLKIYI